MLFCTTPYRATSQSDYRLITLSHYHPPQGKLVRMIEGSTETVRTDTKDTVRLLLLLLVFAVSSSSYVLWEGMKDSTKRSKYQLLLHCVLIVTSVIPPELPMQMALAVNSSLMALMKMQASASHHPPCTWKYYFHIPSIPIVVPYAVCVCTVCLMVSAQCVCWCGGGRETEGLEILAMFLLKAGGLSRQRCGKGVSTFFRVARLGSTRPTSRWRV